MTNAVRPVEQAPEAAVDPPLGADVDGRGGLVEDQDPWVGEQRPRERDELALAEREPEAALADLGVVAVGSSVTNESAPTAAAAASISARVASGRPNAMFSAIEPGEEEALLRHDPELRAQRRLRDLAEVGAVDRDAARARVVEAREQLRDRRLAGARVPDERDGRSCRDVEVEVVEDVRQLAVAEADVLEADVAVDRGQRPRVGGVDDARAPRRARR